MPRTREEIVHGLFTRSADHVFVDWLDVRSITSRDVLRQADPVQQALETRMMGERAEDWFGAETQELR